jgi:hypothetical protein
MLFTLAVFLGGSPLTASSLDLLAESSQVETVGSEAYVLSAIAQERMWRSLGRPACAEGLVAVPIPIHMTFATLPQGWGPFQPTTDSGATPLLWQKYLGGIRQTEPDLQFYSQVFSALFLSFQIAQHLAWIQHAVKTVNEKHRNFSLEEKRGWIGHHVYRITRGLPLGTSIYGRTENLLPLKSKMESMTKLVDRLGTDHPLMMLLEKYLSAMEILRLNSVFNLRSDEYLLWAYSWGTSGSPPVHSPFFVQWASNLEFLFGREE